MDKLFQLLTQRAVKEPLSQPAEDRFKTASAMQDAYRGGWSPNPVLLKLLMNRG